ncbi:MAG: OmpP1/FadL family transporter [bacterium]|nr:OmpP1/FadL family transporter [bacterium]
MKRLVGALLFCFMVSLLSAPTVWGAGFLDLEQGTKARGMAGAFTATADDPSAIFHNVAGITQLPGTQLSIGNTLVRNDQKYSVPRELTLGPDFTEEMQSRTYILPHLYLTHRINDKVTFGFGFNTPFGIGTNWSDRSVGNAVADEAHLKTYDFNPNLAFKIDPKLSLAIGFHYVRAKAQIIRRVGLPGFTPVQSYELNALIPPPTGTGLGTEQAGRFKLDARGGTFAVNFGLLYKVNEFWNLGFSYRSDSNIDVSRSEATVDFAPNPLRGLPVGKERTYAKTKLGLPGIFLAGIATTMFDRWTWEFDVQYTTWNDFDDIEINLKPGLTTLGGVTDLTLEEDWTNGWGFHLGTEYRYTDNFAVRAGYFYDTKAVPDETLGPILPDSDRHNFSLGCGYTKGHWTLDMAYMFSNFENRSTEKNDQDFNASYKTNFHLLGMTVTRRF